MAPPAEEGPADQKAVEETIIYHWPLPTQIAPPEVIDRQGDEREGEEKAEEAGNKWAEAKQKSHNVCSITQQLIYISVCIMLSLCTRVHDGVILLLLRSSLRNENDLIMQALLLCIIVICSLVMSLWIHKGFANWFHEVIADTTNLVPLACLSRQTK